MTTFTAPVFLAEMYDEQIQELGFRDKTEALLYLAEGFRSINISINGNII